MQVPSHLVLTKLSINLLIMSKRAFLGFLMLLVTVTSLLVVSCEKGTLLENLPPETQLFLKEVNLRGENRLNSVIQLYWSGEDKDGYVVGYELSFDETNWGFTTQRDSTFQFDIPAGSDTVDITLYVRAVDNDGERDPTPAFLNIPLRNQPPVARFDTVSVLPDTVFSAGTVLWQVSDPDGDETLESISVKINDGPWVELARTISFLSFLPENPSVAGPQDLILYNGPAATPLAVPLLGAVVGANNKIYLRAKDIAGSFSAIDSTRSFYLRQQQGTLLLVDDNSDSQADQVHMSLLDEVFPTYDRIDIRSNRPSIWDPTLGLILGIYDRVLWYSDGSNLAALGQQLTLEVAAQSLQRYLNVGGKLFISAKFPATFNDPAESGLSPVFGFSPMDSLSSSVGQARIAIDSLASPVGVIAGQLPPLVCGTFITGADPFYPRDPNNALLEAQLTTIGGWVGPRVIAASTRFTNGEINQIFVSVELHRLDRDRPALEAFLDWALNTAFEW